MLKITEYALAEGIDNMRIAIAQGWQPYGNPSFNPGMFKVIQAVVKYEQPKNTVTTEPDNESKEKQFIEKLNEYVNIKARHLANIAYPDTDEGKSDSIRDLGKYSVLTEIRRIYIDIFFPHINQGEPNNE